MATKWQRTKIKIPDEFGPKDREKLAFEVLEFIRERTNKGKNKRNRSFPKYSDSYADSVDFKIAGKSKNKIDLQLSGDMLDAMDLISHKKGEIMIGFKNGTEENARADGNIRGTYGKPSPIPGKKRDFLGITKKDLKTVVDDYRESYNGDE